MSIEESKFYVIKILTRDNFFKKKLLAPRAMKRHIQILYKQSKSEGRRCVQVQGL